ncbi:MAG: methyl-accepting chemotaxis protein [Myxococcota bacterium]
MSTPSFESARDAWLDAFDEGREKILGRIRHARRVSDDGVFRAGDKINGIVKAARSFIERTKESMASSEDGSLEGLVEEVRHTVVDQCSKVREALQYSSDIRKAGLAIEGAATASRLLALNARVEASRLTGSDKKAFDVIAKEVRDLSEDIAGANRKIEDLIDRLLRMLPEIAEEAEQARGMVEELHRKQQWRQAEMVSQMQSSNEIGTETLERILEQARQALSELQFQDPMIQDIEGIDRILVTVRNQFVREIGVGQEVEAQYAAHLSEDLEVQDDGPEACDAGELLLF